MAELKDSGTRREFESGAVRDRAEGKGRADLLPLGEVEQFLGNKPNGFLSHLDRFIRHGWIGSLELALDLVTEEMGFDKESAVLAVSKQFEDGAVKYGDNNWRKGIPLHCYMDSAIRHYLKWRRGDVDEPHDRACLWNLFCALWTFKNLPKMNDLPHYSSQKIHSLCDETHTIDVQQAKPAETYPRTDVCPTCKFFVPKGERGLCSGEFAVLGLLRESQMFEGCELWKPKEGGK